MRRSGPFALIAFDVNGTLLADRQIFCAALNGIFTHFGYTAIEEEELRERFSQPWTEIYRAVGISSLIASDAELYRLYNDLYTAAGCPAIAPHVPEALSVLHQHGIELAIISTQQNAITLPLLEDANLTAFFAEIVGGVDDKSEALAALAADFDVGPAAAAYVGDQDSDMRFARSAGWTAVGYTAGIHTAKHLSAAGADLLCDDFAQLPELLRCL